MRRLLPVLIVLLVINANAGAQSKKLNVLLLCSDAHAAFVCGAYGNKLARTPSIDKLAAGGTTFMSAYCNAPVCTASRQSFFTGRYPRTIGVTQLRTALPASETTLAEILRAAGYFTAAIGKMHFNSNLLHGFNFHLKRADHEKHLRKKGRRKLPDNVTVLPKWKPFRDPARIWLNADHLPYAAYVDEMSGTWYAKKAGEFLHTQSKSKQPFFLMVSFHEPHSPFHFPIEWRHRFNPKQFTPPKVGPEDAWQIPAIFRPLTKRDIQGITASYYTATEFMDQNVGAVLDALKKLGLDDNTLVIYIGDHGYCLGHHGRIEKHCLYEEAVRSPLIMRLPGRIPVGKKNDELVEFIDILPTVLSYCNVPIPKTVQGKSLTPLLSGDAQTHRNLVFVEYAENEEALVCTKDWAFMYGTGKRKRQDGYATGKPLPGRKIRLYDMKKDPGQFHNVADEPQHKDLVANFKQALMDHLVLTARNADMLPQTDDVHEVIDFLLQPRDVGKRGR